MIFVLALVPSASATNLDDLVNEGPSDFHGLACEVDGLEFCDFDSSGTLYCDLRIIEDSCRAGYGFQASMVTWTAGVVSFYGFCPANANPNPV